VPGATGNLLFSVVVSTNCFKSERFPQNISHKIVRTIDDGTPHLETRFMARYSSFLGRAVEVQYRAGDICLPAYGTFVGDSGRSIFLEQHYEQHGQQKNFRWEIPYQYIVRLGEAEPLPGAVVESAAELPPPEVDRPLEASAAHASGGPALRAKPA
jgi:hypothetical protein